MAKKHHMTKHQYAAYKKEQQRYDHPFELEQEESGHTKSSHGKYTKKSEKKMKKLFRNIQGHSGDILDEEYAE